MRVAARNDPECETLFVMSTTSPLKSFRKTYLSRNHYAISDRAAGTLAKSSPGNGGRLPRPGYEREVVCSDGLCILSRTTICRVSDPLPFRHRRRGWVWTLRPVSCGNRF